MQDYLVRIISESGTLRGLACITTSLVRLACHSHQTGPTASVALARGLSGGALMGALLKRDQRVALKFEGNGPLQRLVVEADGNGGVRGFVGDPQCAVAAEAQGRLEVSGAIGRAGLLTVTKDLRLREPYTSTVHLVSGEIAEDLAYYFTESEQIPTAVGLGAYIEPSGEIAVSGGFLIQALPPSEDANIESIISRIDALGSLTELLRQGRTPEEVLAFLFSEVPYEILQRNALEWHCPCSRERMERALISLGSEQLGHLRDEQPHIEMNCEFCRSTQLFSRDDMQRLIDEIRGQHDQH
jgi:molecular chaperone Hsp33